MAERRIGSAVGGSGGEREKRAQREQKYKKKPWLNPFVFFFLPHKTGMASSWQTFFKVQLSLLFIPWQKKVKSFLKLKKNKNVILKILRSFFNNRQE